MDGKELIDTHQEPPAENTAPLEEPFAPAAEPLSAEQVATLKAHSDKATHYYEQLLRVTADLENYKKRAARERQEAVKFANEGLLEKLIPILDNFEMAWAAATAPNASVESIKSGVQM